MSSWINLGAVGLILGLGLVFGAGLPALFAIGLRALDLPGHSRAPDEAGTGSAVLTTKPSPARLAAAVVCFAIVVAAIAAGIYLIVRMS